MFYDSKNFFLGQWENKRDEMGECVCGSSGGEIKRPESLDPGLLAVRGSHNFESILARSNHKRICWRTPKWAEQFKVQIR